MSALQDRIKLQKEMLQRRTEARRKAGEPLSQKSPLSKEERKDKIANDKIKLELQLKNQSDKKVEQMKKVKANTAKTQAAKKVKDAKKPGLIKRIRAKTNGKKSFKPSANLSNAFNANTEDGFNPLSPESKAKNNPKNPPKLKNAPKKKDPDYKLYSGDLAKKYDLKYMTGEAMERDETKRIADGAKSGGHLKKLKHGGKVTKKSKGGFMGKGAGCARRGF